MHDALRELAAFIGWAFDDMSFAIPVKRLRETGSLTASHHPEPAYPFHVLIVPKETTAQLVTEN